MTYASQTRPDANWSLGQLETSKMRVLGKI